MKKVTLLLLILCIGQGTWAQSSTNSNQVEIGITSGIGVFDLPGTFVSRNIPLCVEGCFISDSKASLDFSLGIEARLKLSNWLRVSSGISYSYSSYNEEFTASNGASFFTNLNKRNFDFLNIPFSVNATLYLLNAKSISLFGELGFINHLNMTRSFPDPETNIELNRYGLSGAAGFGLRFFPGKYIFEVGPFFSRSLTSFGNDVSFVNSDSSTEFKPYSVGINISALIEL